MQPLPAGSMATQFMNRSHSMMTHLLPGIVVVEMLNTCWNCSIGSRSKVPSVSREIWNI